MIMPSPLRDMPRPRRQLLPRIVTAIICVAALGAVLMIALGARSPSTSAMPIARPALPKSPSSQRHVAKPQVDRTSEVRQLRRHFPVPRHAHQVRATPYSRAYTASGDLPDLVSFYDKRLRQVHVGWHATDRIAHRSVIARTGRLTVGREPVGHLAIRQTDVGLGIVVRFRHE